MVHSVVEEELCAVNGHLQPFFVLLHFVVEHAECPDLPGLQPDKLIGIINFALFVQAGVEASRFVV